MDAAEVVWQARVAASMSQRELARAAGVSRGTVGNIESGRQRPSWTVLCHLLDVCGLELAVATPVPQLDDRTKHYLRMSTTERLYLSLGGPAPLAVPLHMHAPPVGVQLSRLSLRGTVTLGPLSALGVWLPMTVALPLPVTLHRSEEPAGDWSALEIALAPTAPPPHLIPVGVALQRQVRVMTPVAMALRPEVGDAARHLRAVARHLHQEEGFDRAHRRRPAHRVSDPWREAHEIQTRQAFGPITELPATSRRREWRARSPVSFSQWLAMHRYPDPRNNGRARTQEPDELAG